MTIKPANRNTCFLAPLLLLALGACGDEPANESQSAAPVESASEAEMPAPGLPRTDSPEGAGVFFISPADGDTVSNPVSVEFGIVGMSVAKAGDDMANSGHHHLLIDADLPDLGLPIPASDNYVHFGDGSTSTSLTLVPGSHTLQLLLGDHLHIPHNPPVKSATITIVVE
jgi:hypothetical protein